ncbi:mechanosensitive ion channel domain-containing protein [Noviherbaspirillum pedocola]|uniref:Mechanosensitive ion channel n=1 Tax=Noviherbaspirillum pedocola TaxID=2801341 RepID=A0A934SZV0_9BURK|nr:mechanosensitive ion channel domain-containing protein [Noviherbaspirillum pedocola]MBK4735794.1 mechanosensitive ion channel [Noviherbaspirillum pedocola]
MLSLLFAGLTPAPAALAQTPPAKETAPAKPEAPTPVALAEVAVQSEAAIAQVRRLQNRDSSGDALDNASEALPELQRDVTTRNLEMGQLYGRNTPLDALRSLGTEWRDLQTRATGITRDLGRALSRLDRDDADLGKLKATWQATRDAAASANAPAQLVDRINGVLSEIGKAEQDLQRRRSRLLALQSQAADIGARAAQSTATLTEAEERATARLFYRDSAPLWTTDPMSPQARRLAGENAGSYGEAGALSRYVSEYGRNFALHAALVVAFTGLLMAMRSRVRRLGKDDAILQHSARVFDMPVVSALLISLLFLALYYPRAPRSFWIVAGVLSAVPTLVFVKRAGWRDWTPVMGTVTGFYVLDRLRSLLAPAPSLWRWALALECLLFLLALSWMLRRFHREAQLPGLRLLRSAAWVGVAAFLLALVGDIVGYARLADMLATTALFSAYAGILAHLLTGIGVALLHALLCMPPLSLLGMAKRHAPLLLRRAERALRAVAFLTWLWLTLRALGVGSALLNVGTEWWDAKLPIGSMHPAVSDLVSFALTLWITFLLSRFVRFVLDEEIFPNLRLERGLPYAIKRVVHYAILLTGIVIALGAIGVDMTKFTILAGAFSVGIGFGLQNIVNNFISGLIVLFERPIKVGDTIEVDGQTGRVERIGIRASVMRSTAGSEVIIPNGKLISDKVINWTLSNGHRQISVPVILKPDADAVRAREIVMEVARRHKEVLESPAPEVLFVRRAIDQIEFELRAWTDALDSWMEVRSDLTTEIDTALRQANSAAPK